MSSSSGWRQLFDRDQIYDNLLECCSPATLWRISRTCRISHFAVKDYVARTFNIARHFRRFFADPDAFRALQARTGAVVSGSNALQFLDRTVYTEADLDLYVSRKYVRDVCEWLLEESGRYYRFRPAPHQRRRSLAFEYGRCDQFAGHHTAGDVDHDATDVYRGKRIITVLTFESTPTTPEEKMTKVQVIVSEYTPMDCILGFHSSACFTFAAFEH